MIMNIRVIPKSSKAFIKKENDLLKVYLTKPALGGLVNKQLIELLAEYLNIKKYQIRIVKGGKSKDKIVAIDV